MDLVIYTENIVRNFSRYNKYTLGSDLRNKSRQIACQIMRANSLTEKRDAIEELSALAEEMKILLRIGKETRAFPNFNSYSYSSAMLAEISRQATGWKKNARS